MSDKKKAHKKAKKEDPIRKRMDPEGQRAYDLMFAKHYVLTATIFAYIAGNLLVWVGGGYLLDTVFETKPIFLVIGFVLSFFSTQYCLYKKFKNFNG